MPVRRVPAEPAEDTRLAVLRALLDEGRPLTVAELAERFGLHPNGLRRHLRALVAAGLAVETAEHSGRRGRPALRWAVPAAVATGWSHPTPYERLASMLAEVQATGADPEEIGRRHGASTTTRATGADALTEAMAADGFEPVVDEHGDVVLGACPYAAVAAAHPATVCALHLGLARGIADRDGSVAVAALHPHEPHSGGCVLEVRPAPG